MMKTFTQVCGIGTAVFALATLALNSVVAAQAASQPVDYQALAANHRVNVYESTYSHSHGTHHVKVKEAEVGAQPRVLVREAEVGAQPRVLVREAEFQQAQPRIFGKEEPTPRYTEAPMKLPSTPKIKDPKKTQSKPAKPQEQTQPNRTESTKNDLSAQDNKGKTTSKDSDQATSQESQSAESSNDSQLQADGTQDSEGHMVPEEDLAKTGVEEVILTALFALFLISLGSATILAREYHKLVCYA